MFVVSGIPHASHELPLHTISTTLLVSSVRLPQGSQNAVAGSSNKHSDCVCPQVHDDGGDERRVTTTLAGFVSTCSAACPSSDHDGAQMDTTNEYNPSRACTTVLHGR